MNSKWTSFWLPVIYLLMTMPAFAPAEETNSPPAATQDVSPSTNKRTMEEKNARIEAWRQRRARTNRAAQSKPREVNQNLTREERYVRLRAQVAELRRGKTTMHTNPATNSVTITNSVKKQNSQETDL